MKSSRKKIVFRILSYFFITVIIIASIYIQSCGHPGKLPPNSTNQPDTTKKKSLVLKSRNSSLEKQKSGTNKNLYGVSRYKAGTALVTGDSGTVLTTVNGGINWVTQTRIVTTDLRAAFCIDKDTMLASGYLGTIIRSNNKGVNWINVSIAGINKPLRSISFGDKNTGFIAGDSGNVLKSSNSGINWVPLASFTQKDLYGICFINKDTGFVVGKNGVIYHTSNGGVNWNTVISGTVKDLHSISFSGKRIGTIVGEQSTILQTYNGGATWSPVVSVINSNYTSVSRLSENLCFFVGSGSKDAVCSCGSNQNIIINSPTDPNANGVSGSQPANIYDVTSNYGAAIIVGNDGDISVAYAPPCTNCSAENPVQHDVILSPCEDNCHWKLTVRANDLHSFKKFIKIVTPGGDLDCHISGWTQRDNIGAPNDDLYERASPNTQNEYSVRNNYSNHVNKQFSFPSTIVPMDIDLMTFSLNESSGFSNEIEIEFTLAFANSTSIGSTSTPPLAGIEVYFGNDNSTVDNSGQVDCSDCFQTRYVVSCNQ